MRVEPHTIGSILHVVKRGARGMEIVRDRNDKLHFVRSLYILNDVHQDHNWTRDVGDQLFSRPDHWPERKPLVSILAWTLMTNHFHLLVREEADGGLAKFMQRLGGSLTTRFNTKYKEKGSLFQGAYKGKLVDEDNYLRYLFSYIVVKNTLELYPGGLEKALKNFDQAWEWGSTYEFSSLQTIFNHKNKPILNTNLLDELDLPGSNFKKSAKNMLLGHLKKDEAFISSLLEVW